MSNRLKLLAGVRNVLADRQFSEQQIEKVIPRLHKEHIAEPKYLAEIIDRWNFIMGRANTMGLVCDTESVPPVATAPKNSLLSKDNINMNHILADIEPDLLLFDPDKLMIRHKRIQGLGFINNLGQHWTILFNAPRGFYLQDWRELTKKLYYLEHKVLDFLYEKKEQKEMVVHPLVKSAASIEVDFDHIRTRYMFAMRSGYKSLSHLYDVQMALDRPTLGDIILSSNERFLSKFAPYCSLEEYETFADLIKNHDLDDDDARLFEQLAEVDGLRHEKTTKEKTVR